MPKLFQELPPKGGYPQHIQWRRNLPARGFRPAVYFFGLCGLTAYGFYRLISGIRERTELEREKTWSRLYIQPLLEAEADRDAFRRITSLHNMEADVMKDIPDFDAFASVYHDGRYHKPVVSALPGY